MPQQRSLHGTMLMTGSILVAAVGGGGGKEKAGGRGGREIASHEQEQGQEQEQEQEQGQKKEKLFPKETLYARRYNNNNDQQVDNEGMVLVKDDPCIMDIETGAPTATKASTTTKEAANRDNDDHDDHDDHDNKSELEWTSLDEAEFERMMNASATIDGFSCTSLSRILHAKDEDDDDDDEAEMDPFPAEEEDEDKRKRTAANHRQHGRTNNNNNNKTNKNYNNANHLIGDRPRNRPGPILTILGCVIGDHDDDVSVSTIGHDTTLNDSYFGVDHLDGPPNNMYSRHPTTPTKHKGRRYHPPLDDDDDDDDDDDGQDTATDPETPSPPPRTFLNDPRRGRIVQAVRIRKLQLLSTDEQQQSLYPNEKQSKRKMMKTASTNRKTNKDMDDQYDRRFYQLLCLSCLLAMVLLAALGLLSWTLFSLRRTGKLPTIDFHRFNKLIFWKKDTYTNNNDSTNINATQAPSMGPSFRSTMTTTPTPSFRITNPPTTIRPTSMPSLNSHTLMDDLYALLLEYSSSTAEALIATTTTTTTPNQTASTGWMTTMTPQTLALEWLAMDHQLSSYPIQRMIQRYVLATLYFAGGGTAISPELLVRLLQQQQEQWMVVLSTNDTTTTTTTTTTTSTTTTSNSSNTNTAVGNGTSMDWLAGDLSSLWWNTTQNDNQTYYPIITNSSQPVFDTWMTYDDECTWSPLEIICNAMGQVETLQLQHVGYNGTIPVELGLLSNSLGKCKI